VKEWVIDPPLLVMHKSGPPPNVGPTPLERKIAATSFSSVSGALKGARSSLFRRENKNDLGADVELPVKNKHNNLWLDRITSLDRTE
jgi:hypothetical protein